MKNPMKLLSIALALILIVSLLPMTSMLAKADMLPPESMTYTVTYDLQEGILLSGETTEIVEYNSNYNAMPVVSRAGYTFGGWYTGSGGSGSLIKQGDSLAFLENHTLYAYWVEAFITVTFDEQGGSEVKISTDIRFNSTYSDLPITTRTGYTFGGWWTEANGAGIKVTENTQVTIPINHTLYAKWIANSYTVTFDPQDGVFTSGEETKELTFGTEYGILPEVAKENYIFGGWRTGPDGTGIEVTNTTQVTITDNQILYANWTRPKFTVTFDPRGGTEDFLTWSYTYGERYGIFGIPSYPGYTFNGWYTALNGGTYIDVTTIMSTPNDHTLYAKWTANNYTVSLDPQGGEVTPETLFLQFDSAYGPLPTPTRPNYTFMGWYTASNNGGTLVTDNTIVTTPYNHILYAKWTGNNYTVTFDPQGGDVTPETQIRQFNSPYGDLLTPIRQNYIFEGWYTATDDNGTLVTAETTVSTTNNHVLYAKWTPGNITVTLDPQGGEVSRTTLYYNVGMQYKTLPEPTRTGYSFFGWCTTLGVSKTYIRATDIVSNPNDHTLYAFWVRDVYTITFDIQGGSFLHGESSTKYVSYGGTYGTLPFGEKQFYVLSGWYTEPQGGGTQITSYTPVTRTTDQTLYAKWTLDYGSSHPYVPSPPPYVPTPPPPYVPTPPPPYVPTPPPFITGLSENIGYIVPPSPPPPVEIPPLVVGRMVCPDGTQRVLPGNYESETGRFSFLYDSMPNDITSESSFTMDYSLSAPSGLSDSHWAYQDALSLLAQGILKDEPIIPGAVMTREDLINMLHRTVAFPLDPTNSSRFSDTTINNTALNWAAEKGIINGYPDGTARPDTEITRQEAFVIIARFLGAYKIEYPDAVSDSILESFSDVDDIDNWARDNIGVIVRYGIVRGTPSVNGPAINPLRSVTQEEMIVLLGRMIEVCY